MTDDTTTTPEGAGHEATAFRGRGVLRHEQLGEVLYVWGATPAHLRRECEEMLREKRAFRTVADLREIFGMSSRQIWRRLQHEGAPPFEARRSPGGKVKGVILNQELAEWIENFGTVERIHRRGRRSSGLPR